MTGRVVTVAVAMLLALGACGEAEDERAVPEPSPTAQSPAPTPSGPSPTPATPASSEEPTMPPDTTPTPDTVEPNLPHCGDPSPSRRAPDGMRVTLSASDSTPARGATVTFTLRARNGGSRAVTHTQNDGQAYDVWVSRGGKVVWMWSAGKAFTQALSEETFQAGEQKQIQVEWDGEMCDAGAPVAGKAPPGGYTARGLWRDEAGGWYSNEVDLTVG